MYVTQVRDRWCLEFAGAVSIYLLVCYDELVFFAETVCFLACLSVRRAAGACSSGLNGPVWCLSDGASVLNASMCYDDSNLI